MGMGDNWSHHYIIHLKKKGRLMNEKKTREKNDDLKNKEEPTSCTHSAPHSAVRHFFFKKFRPF